MSQISLTASMRSNLLSLQNTASLMSTTQERLASGKKVNSAVDNPSSYYTAQSLNNRANDLSALLDSMGQAISTIKAANEGIESITSFVEQAKAIANSAVDTTDNSTRIKYADQFNEILSQIDKLKNDSGYKGVNLIGGEGTTLTVKFNEGGSSSLAIASVDASHAGLGIKEAGWKTAISATDAGTATDHKVGSGGLADGKMLIDGDDRYVNVSGDTIAENTTIESALAAGKLNKLTKIGASDYFDLDSITDAIDEAAKAIEKLRGYASTFGNNYSIVQTREEFTNNLINVLEEGADKLTLADMNEESANMLALQTRQQLAINSLSLASTAAQSVLKLF